MLNLIESINKLNQSTQLFNLGQAGYVVKNKQDKLLGIDLYLSDCVEFVEGHDGYHRLLPKLVNPAELHLDIIIATHFHRDHFDIDSIPVLMSNGKTHLYCSYDCIDDVEKLKLDKSRVTFVKPNEQYENSGFILKFINSDHGEGAPLEVGVIITTDDGKNIVNVGDTSLHIDWKSEYLSAGPVDVLIAPINGAYGNLNEEEQVMLTKTIAPKLVVPSHYGMFASHGGCLKLWRDILKTQIPGQEYKIFTMGEGIEI